MKRILFLAADLCSRGAERQMVSVACLLKKQGYDVSFVCYHTNNFFEYILQENNIPVNWIHLPQYLQRMLRIRRYIRDGRYDVVISFLPVDNFLNDFAALGRHNWKVITGERSSKESSFASRERNFFCRLQKQSNYIVCNSSNARNMWMKYYPQYDGKLKVIYNTVQLPSITSEYVIRRNNKTNLVVAGAYSYVKDPQSLIKAIALLSDENRQKLSVDWYGKIGSNEEAKKVFEECMSLIKENNLENIITLKDATSDIANRMKEADVVALFSKWEGLPNSICEGMAIGKPVLMTRISDYNQLIDETNGFLCDVQSPSSIKVALELLLRLSDEELVSMGETSKKKAERLFSSQKIVSEWIKLIE